jgi:hypothetical protein
MKSIRFFVFAILASFLLSSCLTAHYKEYKFELTGLNSGKLTIKWVNIMSKRDDADLTEKEELEKDFQDLMDKYINGYEIEESYPEARLVSKRLFEENNMLCGEVVIEFSDFSQAMLYQMDKNSPIIYYLGSLSSEVFDSSNGVMGPDYCPVVLWASTQKLLKLINKLHDPEDECTSLLEMWKGNK